MFDEESKERLISIIEDRGFDFDYEEEPKKHADMMWCEDIHFNIQFEAAKFTLLARVATSIENSVSNNGVGWCAELKHPNWDSQNKTMKLPNWDSLSESEVLGLYKDLNDLNRGSSSFGISHLFKEEGGSMLLQTVGRTYLSSNYLSNDDALLMELYLDVFKARLETIAKKFC